MRTSTLTDYYTPREEELRAYDAAFARLDALSGTLGITPAKPIPGEMVSQYRKRLLKEVLPHSPRYKHTNVIGLRGDALDFAEEMIYADAVRNAHDPMSVPPGQTRTIQYRDEANRLITKTVGQTPTWMDHFTTAGMVCTIKRDK